MGDTILFAPQVRSIQPAFVNGGEARIYFSLNTDIDPQVNAIEYKIIDPNKSATDGLDLVKEGVFSISGDASFSRSETGEYYFTIKIDESDNFNDNQYYQLQIRQLVVTDSIIELVSAWSQISLIKVLANDIDINISNEVEEDEEGNVISYLLQPFDNLILNGSISSNILKYCAFETQGYTAMGNISGAQFEIPMKAFFIDPDTAQVAGTLRFETVDGYEGSENIGIKLDVIDIEETDILTLSLDFPAGGILIERIPAAAASLIRKPSNENIWTTVADFKAAPALGKWLDCTVEGGVVYQYRVLNTNKESIAFSNDSPEVDFEDIFLSDSNTMIVIRYNSSISGLKYVSQEAITNTLGGKYPIIRKNGDTKYKQFSISGLFYLDYCLDEGCLYTTEPLNIQLAAGASQRAMEKKLRQIAETFLTNGQPKIFKSYDEGPMIVHISNVSFSPNKQLNNHIYDFSAQVTEICDFNSDNLKKYKFNLASFQKYFLGEE